jgi:hypothetical protein
LTLGIDRGKPSTFFAIYGIYFESWAETFFYFFVQGSVKDFLGMGTRSIVSFQDLNFRLGIRTDVQNGFETGPKSLDLAKSKFLVLNFAA